jgi:hypothetical protein
VQVGPGCFVEPDECGENVSSGETIGVVRGVEVVEISEQSHAE